MRRTDSAIAILSALHAGLWKYEAQLVTATLLDSRQVSRVLARMEEAGLVESFLEPLAEADSFERGRYSRRAPRRYYRLTGAGEVLRREWGSGPP